MAGKSIYENYVFSLYVGTAVTPKQRKTMFDTEMMHMTSVAKALMESVSHAKIEFTSAKHHEHVRPMFKVFYHIIIIIIMPNVITHTYM